MIPSGLYALAVALLSQENGINETSYDALWNLARNSLEWPQFERLFRFVDTTDGRFYLSMPEGRG